MEVFAEEPAKPDQVRATVGHHIYCPCPICIEHRRLGVENGPEVGVDRNPSRMMSGGVENPAPEISTGIAELEASRASWEEDVPVRRVVEEVVERDREALARNAYRAPPEAFDLLEGQLEEAKPVKTAYPAEEGEALFFLPCPKRSHDMALGTLTYCSRPEGHPGKCIFNGKTISVDDA